MQHGGIKHATSAIFVKSYEITVEPKEFQMFLNDEVILSRYGRGTVQFVGESKIVVDIYIMVLN